MTLRHALDWADPRLATFWRERRHGAITTLRPDGSPHTVPVAPVADPASRRLLVLTSAGSVKARNVARSAAPRASVCEIAGRHWVTAEGVARLERDPDFIAACERRYAERFRVPRENPDRVVLVIDVDRLLGRLPDEGAVR